MRQTPLSRSRLMTVTLNPSNIFVRVTVERPEHAAASWRNSSCVAAPAVLPIIKCSVLVRFRPFDFFFLFVMTEGVGTVCEVSIEPRR